MIHALSVSIDNMVTVSYRAPGDDWSRVILSCDEFVEIAAEYLPVQLRKAINYFENLYTPDSWDICKFFIDEDTVLYTIQHYLLTAYCDSFPAVTEKIAGFENAIARRDELKKRYPDYSFSIAYISDDINPFKDKEKI